MFQLSAVGYDGRVSGMGGGGVADGVGVRLPSCGLTSGCKLKHALDTIYLYQTYSIFSRQNVSSFRNISYVS